MLSVLFFVFLRDEILLPNNPILAKLPEPAEDSYSVFEGNPAEFLLDYDKLVRISVGLGSRSFGP